MQVDRHGCAKPSHPFAYKRANHANMHMHGYEEENSVPKLGAAADYAKQAICDKLVEHHRDIREHGINMPKVRERRRCASRDPSDTSAASRIAILKADDVRDRCSPRSRHYGVGAVGKLRDGDRHPPRPRPTPLAEARRLQRARPMNRSAPVFG
jgi:hypothetical protein